ncbi:P-loop containing nucleoside triphosphate hydrolase protein, partial [Blyttiomyces helicus]
KARTVAATNMNETSSRSHAVFTVILTQRTSNLAAGTTTQKVSRICLVDLAGSERADATGATGMRLKEGANINKSLTTLGKVISALADAGASRRRLSKLKKAALEGAYIPYRDSALTWLLKDCLGGNSKTVMIAAISPADINYEETLSTLRYAERAKRIVNKAVVNEDATGKLVRDLQEEVAVLRARLLAIDAKAKDRKERSDDEEDEEEETAEEQAAHVAAFREADAELSAMKDQLQASEKLIADISESYEEKLRKTNAIQLARERALEDLGIAV